MILFDIRSDDSHTGLIAVVNRALVDEPGNPYLSRFGHVASPHWWACFDRGEIPVEVHTGEVSHVGQRLDWCDELEDVIEFSCNGGTIAYDRRDYWAAHPIRVGDQLRVISTIIEISNRNGPLQFSIDLRAEWMPAPKAQNQA